MLAVLCTPLFSGFYLASLHTLLHQHQDHPVGRSQQDEDACSFASSPFMGVTESRGGADTQLKQRDFVLVGRFILPGFPY